VVECRLERACGLTPAASSAAAATPAPPAPGGSLFVPLGLLILVLVAAPGFRGFELGRDQRVVLGAKVDLVVEICTHGLGLGARFEALLALEGLDLLNGDLELVRDPRIGSPLTHPCADPVELGP
jgi:hypothetical protein